MIALISFLAAHVPGGPLSSYLSAHPWDAKTRGSMFVVNPDSTYSDEDSDSLAAFHRQEMKAGKLTAIAPTEMVIIETNPKEEPNFFDCLPRTDKVYYFLSLLNSDQWKLASNSGLAWWI